MKLVKINIPYPELKTYWMSDYGKEFSTDINITRFDFETKYIGEYKDGDSFNCGLSYLSKELQEEVKLLINKIEIYINQKIYK